MKTRWLAVFGGDAEQERRMVFELESRLSSIEHLRCVPRLEVPPGEPWVAVLPSTSQVETVAQQARAAGAHAVYLLQGEADEAPPALVEGWVDDVLLVPIRPLELVSKLAHLDALQRFEDLREVNLSLAGLTASLREDLRVVEALHLARQPRRLGEYRGFRVESRYLAGMRSGGDHFDVIESKDGSRLSLLLSDSSSFGLSSAVLSALMRVSLRVAAESSPGPAALVGAIYDEVRLTLEKADRLSLFCGSLSRKDLLLKYTHWGTSVIFHSPQGGDWQRLTPQGAALTPDGLPDLNESELKLSPKDRLVFLTDGFLEGVGGLTALEATLKKHRGDEPKVLLNELVFQVKRELPRPDDFPEQDCTAIVLDVDSNVVRLALR
jgi:serine phosphatase RsbU (regulator of sigma subunit)